MFAFICIEYCKYHLGKLTWVSQKLSFTVSPLLSWKLPLDRSDLSRFHGKGCDFPGPITRNASTMLMSGINTEVHPKSPEFFQIPSSKPSVLLWSSKTRQRPCSAKAGQSTKSANLKPKTLIGIQYLITEKNFKKYHKMSRLRQVCKETLLRLGIYTSTKLDSTWRAAQHVIVSFKIWCLDPRKFMVTPPTHREKSWKIVASPFQYPGFWKERRSETCRRFFKEFD